MGGIGDVGGRVATTDGGAATDGTMQGTVATTDESLTTDGTMPTEERYPLGNTSRPKNRHETATSRSTLILTLTLTLNPKP